MEINENQKVKIVFICKSADVGGTGIYIDGNKIARIKNNQKIEAFVTPKQHKLNLKDCRFINVDYILNISPEIKTIYVDVEYSLTWRYKVEYPEIKNVRIEKKDSQQSDLVEDDGTIVKQIKATTILSPLSLISSILGYYFELLPLGVLAIILGIVGHRRESYNKFARLAAFGGIIFGIGAVLNTLLQMQINYYR